MGKAFINKFSVFFFWQQREQGQKGYLCYTFSTAAMSIHSKYQKCVFIMVWISGLFSLRAIVG